MAALQKTKTIGGSMTNDYDILGLSLNASQQEIEEAYQKWIRYFTLVVPNIVRHQRVREAYEALRKKSAASPKEESTAHWLLDEYYKMRKAYEDLKEVPAASPTSWVEAYLKDPLGWPSPIWKGPMHDSLGEYK